MKNKNEIKKKMNETGKSIAAGFQKVLLEHGFENQMITRFSLGATNTDSPVESTPTNCPPGYVRLWVQINNNTWDWRCRKIPQ
jgi:hypothetical protein